MRKDQTSTAGEAADALHRRRRHKERGQSTIELALTLPVLLILLLGLIEFGHAFNSYLTLVAAARDAARLASEGQTSTANLRALIGNETARLPSESVLHATNDCSVVAGGVCIYGINELTGAYDPGADPPCTSPDSGDVITHCVKVKVCYDHPMIVGIPFFTDAKMLHMCSQTTMRLATS